MAQMGEMGLVELRDIEIFLALAEELHFGRAAERLHVSAARVSQAIKKQERAIGAELFARNNRGVRLTRLGEQFRDDLRQVHQGLTQTLDRARLAARGKTGILRVSLFPANFQEQRRYWDTFRARHPQWDLRLRMSTYQDPFAQLRSGDADVLITWLPVEEPDLTVGPLLFAEPRVLAVSGDHALTRRSSISLEAVGDFQHVVIKPVPGYWFDHYVPDLTPKGRLIDRTANVDNLEDVFMSTALGEAVTLFPAHVSRYYPRPDIAYLPVKDMAALPFGLVWRSDAENDMIRALSHVVRDLGPLPG
ncbi:DNA-binding transcriptional regulator, LysR family [Nonomuraea solani]|uniref:DNA-binding transcriptional regulator, LysR family n=1 Tax=Nonomuraea solani TaxID=1144553 RepID=A0A1H6EPU0_9ACTN|nr:LysR family transcriptional regulator [Nonomuraea solani]SEG99036.1 DNA-binding transcriptional regulator, LysR family [Nonomuraea solani]